MAESVECGGFHVKAQSLDGRGVWRSDPIVPLLSAITALVPIVVLCIFEFPFYSMNPDDQVQALFASGRFLNADNALLMPYTLAPVSVPLTLLYRVFPAVPWYPLMLLVGTFISFAIAYDHLWRGGFRDALCLSLTAVLVALEVVTLGYFTYTVVAFLVISAGFMLLLRHCAFERDAHVRVSDVAGCALIIAGYGLRPESGMAALAVFSPFAIWVFMRNRRLSSVVRGIAAVGCIALTVVSGQIAYRLAPGWQSYPAYLDAGRSVLDYPALDVDEVREIAPRLSENDVEVMYDWDFIDEDVFGTALFDRIGAASTRFNADNLLDSFGAKTTYLLLAFVCVTGLLAWLVARDLNRRDVGVLAFGIVFMLFVGCGVLVLRARPRLHVVIPLFIVALFALSTCGFAPRGAQLGKHAATSRERNVLFGRFATAIPVFVALGACVGCFGFFRLTVSPLSAQAVAPTVAAAHEYVEDHPEQLVVCVHTQKLLYGAFNALEFEEWDFPQNMLPVGGWESHTAPWYSFLEAHGLASGDTLMELARRDDMVAIVQPRAMELLRTYLAEHLGRSISVDVVEDLGPGVVDPASHLLVCRFIAE